MLLYQVEWDCLVGNQIWQPYYHTKWENVLSHPTLRTIAVDRIAPPNHKNGHSSPQQTTISPSTNPEFAMQRRFSLAFYLFKWDHCIHSYSLLFLIFLSPSLDPVRETRPEELAGREGALPERRARGPDGKWMATAGGRTPRVAGRVRRPSSLPATSPSRTHAIERGRAPPAHRARRSPSSRDATGGKHAELRPP